MDITWYGHSCFRLTERGMANVVTDPFDHEKVGYSALKLRGDIVTVSHDAPGHNHIKAVKGYNHAITGPGEYEIGGVFITGVQTDGHNKKASTNHARNTLFVFDYNGITISHLGNLKQVPSQAEVEVLGRVNVVLVPIGGGEGLNAAKSAEVVSLLEPNIVIPMHYATKDSKIELDTLNKFLKEMGVQETQVFENLKVSKNNLPEETRVVVLEHQSS